MSNPTPKQITETALRMISEMTRDQDYLLNGLPDDGPDEVRLMGVDFFRHPDRKWRMYPAPKSERWPFDQK